MIPLPIDEYLSRILASLKAHRNLVLVAEPGAGKTTRVPPALVREAGANDEILLLQPRRIAARMAARRISEEQGWTLGQEVGFQVRFEKRTSRETRLKVVTEGILNRRLQNDPALKGVRHVILDEFHERSIHTDLALSLLREAQQSFRDDLHIIVMSATLEAEPVATFLGDCPIIRVPGRSHPIDLGYAQWGLPLTTGPNFIDAVVEAVKNAVLDPQRQGGHFLVFLPGAGEIQRCLEKMEPLARQNNLLLLPLHGSLTTEEQDLALRPSTQTKVICATNLAETSLTIDGVHTVIDAGQARGLHYDPETGLERLRLTRISRASADQRAGRAGRQGPGRCLRLWTKHEDTQLEAHEEPEVMRVDLCETLLLLAQWGISDPRGFGWFQKPAEAALLRARALLQQLGALHENGQITDVGRALAHWPVHPRLARILQAAVDADRFVEELAVVAALLSEKDILSGNSRQGQSSVLESDVLLRLEMILEKNNSLDRGGVRHILRVRDQLTQMASTATRLKDSERVLQTKDREEFVLRALLLGYPDRVCRRRRANESEARMVGGKGMSLGRESVVERSEFFLCLATREREVGGQRRPFAQVASRIDPAWLMEYFPKRLNTREWVELDPELKKVQSFSCRFYEDLPLEEPRPAPVRAEVAAPLLAQAMVADWEKIVQAQPEATQWLARLEFLQTHMPEMNWPVLDQNKKQEIAEMMSFGEVDLQQVLTKSIHVYLEGMLSERQKSTLAKEAPQSIAVPSGRSLPIRYSREQGAVLEARLQELFGWRETPKLASGRVPLTLELLGPNYRPVQVTRDLKSFWEKGYQEVRKELRARYPKHSWPEDPWTARAEAKGVRRR